MGLHSIADRELEPGAAAPRSDSGRLRALAIMAGVCWSALFVLVGLYFGLELYADGSLFSYAIAVRDSWGFHWHNISGRLFVHLFSHMPAEIYAGLGADARGAIALYGLLFFSAQLLGLVATFAADRSQGRVFFSFACLSTAALCPVVFGFPTETWITHALFWPTLALCHYARTGLAGILLVFLALLALMFTHEGALIFVLAILLTLALRGWRDAALHRAVAAFLVVLPIWAAVKAMLPPDDYTGAELRLLALHVFDPRILTAELTLLLLGALAGYALVFLALRPLAPAKAHLHAAAIVAAALGIYWLWFDRALHADNRYYLRTVILVLTPAFGILAALFALHAEGRLKPPFPVPRLLLEARANEALARAAMGALLLVMLVHAVETAKFAAAWESYKDAVRTLAVGTASDPALGDARFVSSQRISPSDNLLAWSSTTHFLSVLLAPSLVPARLVIDPDARYFWISCERAKASEAADAAIPAQSRALVRVHACLHR
jgi:hypothetical protein